MIYETIITTVNRENTPHIAPFGVRYVGDNVIISPYQPSTTLENILATQIATLNITDDVRVFAGALTGHMMDDALQSNVHKGYRLANALSHMNLKLIDVKQDVQRSQLIMQKIFTEHHAPFLGFNRAQAAVIEMCILISRLNRLPKEKVLSEMAYLQIAIDKTAAKRELEAWRWLTEKVAHFYAISKQ